jgi:membrane-associated protease RseP (regulator of RpoE activity)
VRGQPQPGGAPRRRLLPGDPYSPARIALHAALFLMTIVTTLWVGINYNAEAVLAVEHPGLGDLLLAGLPYSATLMAILLTHEMGHFVTGRVHRVRLSLPYFVPLPFALGTLGAIIAMPPLESRKKLIDVGAAGPLAGLLVATVTMVVGLELSEVASLEDFEPGTILFVEGQSLYYMALKYIVVGPLPPGHDVFLHPVAWASWIGLLVTMLNLVPAGQLDGGHIAYALFGPRQNRYSGYVNAALVVLGLAVAAFYGIPAALAGQSGSEVWMQAQAGLPWLVWALLLLIIKRRTRVYHPPAPDPTPLSGGRLALGGVNLVLFVLLFMPVPLRVVQL